MDRPAERGTSAPSAASATLAARAPSRHVAVAKLGHVALSGVAVGEVLDLAVDLVCEVLAVEYAMILNQSSPGGPLILVAGRGWGSHVVVGETAVPADGSQAGYTLRSLEPVLVEDLALDERFDGPPILADHDVVSGISVAIPQQDLAYGVLGIYTSRRQSFEPDDGEFLRSIANIIGGALQSHSAREQNERRLSYEAALAECARILLVSTGDNRLEQAVEALLSATHATYVVVERNVMDPDLGLCCQIVVDAERPGASDYGVGADYWRYVPWDRMPTSRRELEQGKPFFLIPEELTGAEYEQYAADPFPVKSELDIPIFVSGEWAGLIEFTDSEVVRDWTEEEVTLLTTAATMIGAHWEREAAREQLQELNREKDALLASVSHELRTPLIAVVGFSQLLQDAADEISDDERAEIVEMLVAHGTELTNITNDLLVAAQAEVGVLEVTPVPVNLHAQTAQVVEAFERDQAVDIGLIGRSVPATGDPDRIRQIVRNLVSNALRYGGDAVRVEVVGGGDTSSVLVCDDGPAIPDEDRERIFQRFQRARNSPGVAGSLGLGLVISRELAQLMGGDLTYRHENGESVFELSLPRG